MCPCMFQAIVAGTVEAMAMKIMVGTAGHPGAHLTGVGEIILLTGHLTEVDQEEIDLDLYLILHTGVPREAATVGVQMFMEGRLANHVNPAEQLLMVSNVFCLIVLTE